MSVPGAGDGFATEGRHLTVPDLDPAELAVLGPRLAPGTIDRLHLLVCPPTAAALMLALATDPPAPSLPTSPAAPTPPTTDRAATHPPAADHLRQPVTAKYPASTAKYPALRTATSVALHNRTRALLRATTRRRRFALLYLHGLSSGDFGPALGQFLGSSAGLSAPVITKLTETWKAEQRAFAARDLSDVDYVYLWADGIHVNIRLEEHKLCLLVMIGVRSDGRKELVALADGYRESVESWADLLRDAARRGMRAPVLAAGDGALGFWGALREVFPQARAQRCWFHKIANILGALPNSAHPGATTLTAATLGTLTATLRTLLSCLSDHEVRGLF